MYVNIIARLNRENRSKTTFVKIVDKNGGVVVEKEIPTLLAVNLFSDLRMDVTQDFLDTIKGGKIGLNIKRWDSL